MQGGAWPGSGGGVSSLLTKSLAQLVAAVNGGNKGVEGRGGRDGEDVAEEEEKEEAVRLLQNCI